MCNVGSNKSDCLIDIDGMDYIPKEENNNVVLEEPLWSTLDAYTRQRVLLKDMAPVTSKQNLNIYETRKIFTHHGFHLTLNLQKMFTMK